ncbi:hypothetical protein GCM10023219_15580 [Stakelama sediminis]|uniref:General secretion pathway protein L n=1 Tax=Stakelama sediminis TaxID=463200 RepID=A0A840YXK7_9SPHN|nr:type II secretion system protein GspL [Stakelama sediminis]MBB5718287.1 general secretion pathway protein L [Stakelama sediminis]
MAETILIALPAAPEQAPAETPWWRIADGAVIAHGEDARWLDVLADPAITVDLIALAPVSRVRLGFAHNADMPVRQAVAVARVRAGETSLGDPETLHIVAAAMSGADGMIATATVANDAMLGWREWLDGLGCKTAAIVPAGLAMPYGEDWHRASLAGETVLARGRTIFPDEPALVQALAAGAAIADVDPATTDTELVALAQTRPLNLLTGRFAIRRRWKVDRLRLRELLILLALVAMLGLLIALAQLWRIDHAANRLDAEAARAASQALGKPVTIDTAEAELDAKAARRPGTGGDFASPLAALFAEMEGNASVTATAIGWQGDGTLTATLAAPRAEDINRVLLALQRQGWTATAVSRNAPDGRIMADITLRATP